MSIRTTSHPTGTVSGATLQVELSGKTRRCERVVRMCMPCCGSKCRAKQTGAPLVPVSLFPTRPTSSPLVDEYWLMSPC